MCDWLVGENGKFIVFFLLYTHWLPWHLLNVLARHLNWRQSTDTMPWRKKKLIVYQKSCIYVFRIYLALCVQYAVLRCISENVAVYSAITLNGKAGIILGSFIHWTQERKKKFSILHSYTYIQIRYTF